MSYILGLATGIAIGNLHLPPEIALIFGIACIWVLGVGLWFGYKAIREAGRI